MTTIKSYTDIEQSRKLAEILPIESADMYWFRDDTETPKIYPKNMMKNSVSVTLPCWSLTALFGVLPMIRKCKDIANPFIAKTPDNEYYVVHATLTEEVDSSAIYDNPVDACVEMIERLYEESNVL